MQENQSDSGVPRTMIFFENRHLQCTSWAMSLNKVAVNEINEG